MNVTNVRRARDDEVPSHWAESRRPNPQVLVLENGEIIMPAQDPELNGPGHLLGYDPDDDQHFDFVTEDE